MLSPAKKHTRAFIKQRITFYSNGVRESKNQMFNALNEKRDLKIKIGTKEPSKAEAERLGFLSYVAKQASVQASQYHNKVLKWRKKKNELFPVEKK